MPLDATGQDGVVAGAEQGRRRWRDPCGSYRGWLILQVKYGQDCACHEALTKPRKPTHRAWDARLLRVWERRTQGERVRRVLVPMLPGYLPVRVEPGDPWQQLRSVRGAVGLLMRLDLPEVPAMLSAQDIAHLEAMAVSREEALNAEDRPPAKGDRIGWRGFEGVCLWTKGDRIRLLMRMLGRDTEATLPIGAVKLLARAEEG